jgi:hypothetical protein
MLLRPSSENHALRCPAHRACESRPSACGPNSPLRITSVLSSSPRCVRFLSSAAVGWSFASRFFSSVRRVCRSSAARDGARTSRLKYPASSRNQFRNSNSNALLYHVKCRPTRWEEGQGPDGLVRRPGTAFLRSRKGSAQGPRHWKGLRQRTGASDDHAASRNSRSNSRLFSTVIPAASGAKGVIQTS